jgi:hypothetical protein
MDAIKDMRGNWHIEETVPLTRGRVLKISTHKVHSGALVTIATAGRVEGGFFTFMMYADFSTRWAFSQPVRVTARAVENQHWAAMASIDEIKAAAEAHYPQIAVDQTS